MSHFDRLPEIAHLLVGFLRNNYAKWNQQILSYLVQMFPVEHNRIIRCIKSLQLVHFSPWLKNYKILSALMMLIRGGLTDVVFKHVLFCRHAQLNIVHLNAQIYTFGQHKLTHTANNRQTRRNTCLLKI